MFSGLGKPGSQGMNNLKLLDTLNSVDQIQQQNISNDDEKADVLVDSSESD